MLFRSIHVELALDEWFHTVQANNAVITDETIRQQALKLGASLNLVDFRASNNWLTKFKKRHSIKQYACHGEAGSADKLNVVIGQEFCREFFKDVSADNIWNADEAGVFYKQLPVRTLGTHQRDGKENSEEQIYNDAMLQCNIAQLSTAH